jgi:hypothetical protein
MKMYFPKLYYFHVNLLHNEKNSSFMYAKFLRNHKCDLMRVTMHMAVSQYLLHF